MALFKDSLHIIMVVIIVGTACILPSLQGKKFKNITTNKAIIKKTFTMGNRYLIGQKDIRNGLNGTSNTNVLTIRFKNFSNAEGFSGVLLKIRFCLSAQLDSNNISDIVYGSEFYILPGEDQNQACQESIASAESTAIFSVRGSYADSSNITGHCVGTGKEAIFQLANTEALENQSGVLYYEIISHNIESIS